MMPNFDPMQKDTEHEPEFWSEVLQRFADATRTNVSVLDELGNLVQIASQSGRAADDSSTRAEGLCPHHSVPSAAMFHREVVEEVQRTGTATVRQCPVGSLCVALPMDTGLPTRRIVLVDCFTDISTSVEQTSQRESSARREGNHGSHLPDVELLGEILQRLKEWVSVSHMHRDLDFVRRQAEALQIAVRQLRSLVGVDHVVLTKLRVAEVDPMKSHSAGEPSPPPLPASRNTLLELAVVAYSGAGSGWGRQASYPLRGDSIELSVAELQQPRVVEWSSNPAHERGGESILIDALQAGSYMAFPLVWEGATIGILYVAFTSPDIRGGIRTLSEATIRFISGLSPILGRALAAYPDRSFYHDPYGVTKMKHELQHRTEALEVYREIEGAICSPCDLQDLLELILTKAIDLVRSNHWSFHSGGSEEVCGCIAFVESGHCRLVAASGYPQATLSNNDFSGSLLACVASSGESLSLSDSGHLDLPGGLNPASQSALAVPMKLEDSVVGVLLVESAEADAFTEEDRETLKALANHAAIAYENARLFRQAQDETRRSRELAERMATLYELAGANRLNLHLDEYLDTLVDKVNRLMRADECSVFLRADDSADTGATSNTRWVLKATRGLPQEFVSQVYAETGRGLTGWIAQEGQLLRLTSAHDQPDLFVPSNGSNGKPPSSEESVSEANPSHARFHSAITGHLIGVPLKIDEETIGILRVRRPTDAPPFATEDESFLRALAEQSASAIHNALLMEKLTEEDYLKSQLMSTLAHELKTPLTSILLFTEILQTNSRPAEEQAELLGIIKEEAERYTRLVDKVMMTSKIEAGKLAANKTPTDIEKVASQVALLFRSQADKRNIGIQIRAAERLPLVMADADLIKQALANLVDNALKFSYAGGTVDITLEQKVRSLGSGGHLVITVRDTGKGINPEAQNHILERFWQGDGTVPGSVVGTGLGLSIVKHIAELHGSKIVFESNVGKGSQFSFALPLAETSLDDLEAESMAGSRQKEVSSE